VADLQSKDQDAWFSGLRFLRERGIVLDASRLVSEWPSISDDQKALLFQIRVAIRSGQTKWKTSLEDILRAHPVSSPMTAVESLLLRELARVGSPMAHPIAFKIIKAGERSGIRDLAAKTQLNLWAVLELTADETDLDQLLVWSKAVNWERRLGALRALARL